MNKVIASAFFLVVTSAFSPVIAYPKVEMQACMANALNAVVTKGLKVNYTQVKNYCDCTMRKIVDEGLDINASLAYCNAKYIF